jgi:hypothetical protein
VTCKQQHAQVLLRILRQIVRLPLILLFLAALPFGWSRSAQAQSSDDPHKPYALIFGTVWGPDDRPVYGVPVKIRRSDEKKAKWQLQSDHRGEFAQRLPAGKADYVVWADLKGVKFKGGKKLVLAEEVTVHIMGDERIDIGLHLK